MGKTGRRVALATAVGVAVGSFVAAQGVAHAAARYTITGRGWGHGVGMSQWGAYGMARQGRSHARIIRHYYPGVGLASRPADTIRVLLTDQAAEVSVASSSTVTFAGSLATTVLPAGHTGVLGVGASGLWVRDATTGCPPLDLGADATVSPAAAGLLRLASPDANGVRQRRYRGVFIFRVRGGRIRLVNRLPVEDYLRGVLPAEVSPSWPVEALKAQAVAARSYALSSSPASADFDVWATVRSQYYGGAGIEHRATDAAVAATRGRVATYAGRVAHTYFFSCSGGRTESVEKVWGGSPVAYLRSVADPYDSYAGYHIWPLPAVLDEAVLSRRLGPYGAGRTYGVKGALKGIRIAARGASPRVVRLEVVGSRGVTKMSGERFRSVLGLRSTWFSVTRVALAAAPQAVAVRGRLRVTGSVFPRPRTGRARLTYREAGSATRSVDVTLSALGGFSRTFRPRRRLVCTLASGRATSPAVTVRVGPGLKLTGAREVHYGRTLKAAIVVTPARPGSYASIYRRRSRETSWRRMSRVRLTSRPTTVTLNPGRNAAFRVRWEGDATYDPAELTTTITVKPIVTLGASSASVSVGTTVTLSGVIVPSKPGSQVTVELLDGGRWKALARRAADASSSYAVEFRPSAVGTYLLRSRVPPSVDYDSGMSPQLSVAVR